MQEEDFAKRLSALRQEKGVSARDMSLSLGQNAGYINNIENGHNFPSITVFSTSVNIWELLQKNFLIMTMNRRILRGNYWKH